ncbi:MAG: ATP12 family protein [Paracoccaceae bacterium]
MSWKNNKRFWDKVTVQTLDQGFEVHLDERPLNTPAQSRLIVPTRDLATAIAKEWRAQSELIKPETMPFTKTANSAIDKVIAQKADVADMLAAYGDSDLLCYRADTPGELVARQNLAWDPVLKWAADTLDVRLVPRVGVMHIPQSQEATAKLAAMVHDLSGFELAGFHDLVALTGSLILAFATLHSFASPKEIWLLSRVDEIWQQDQWGEDEEACAQEAIKRKAFYHAETFIRLVQRKA